MSALSTAFMIGTVVGIVVFESLRLIIRQMFDARRKAKVLVIVDDPKSGSIGLHNIPVKDGSYTTENGALVRFDATKARRVTADKTGKFGGMTAYLADKHSGVLADRDETQRLGVLAQVEHVNKEAARFVSSKAVRELGSDPGIDLGPWVKYAAIVITFMLVVVLILGVTYIVKSHGGGS